MAQRRLIYVADDNSIVSSSPLTFLDTLYYETWFRIQGSGNETNAWNQQIDNSPLPTISIASPAGDMPYISLQPLPDDTTYEFKMRRFNSLNQASEWFEGTFTTGISG